MNGKRIKNTHLIRDRIIAYLIDIVGEKDRSFSEKMVYSFLVLLSKIYGLIIKIRLKFFKWGFLKNKTLGCLVISVGNITTGGTGKTPIVQVFAKALSMEGRKVAILTRGYRRKSSKNKNSIIVVNGKDPKIDPYEVGDEAFLLARNLGDIPVVVGKDRLATGEYAINKLGADTLILDDGYQYLSLSKRVNIVCVDANNPFGNGNLIPAGYLREPLASLKRANLFFLTKVMTKTNGNIKKISDNIRIYNKDASIVETTYVPKSFVGIENGKPEPLESIQGKKIIALSAIAAPQGFEELLIQCGAKLEKTYRFPDHHYFSEDELMEINKKCKEVQASMIIMTEKDSVKIPKGFKFKNKAFFLKVDVTIIKGAESFTDCISRLCFK